MIPNSKNKESQCQRRQVSPLVKMHLMLLIKVFEQGGFAAEYKTEDNLLKIIKENPAKQHEFLAVRQRLIKLKTENPHMRFRLEANGCTRESVKTSLSSEVGLEAPESYWVELSAYELEHGKANPADIVYEEYKGVLTKGDTCLHWHWLSLFLEFGIMFSV